MTGSLSLATQNYRPLRFPKSYHYFPRTTHETIREMITEQMGRGVTVFKGEKGYGKQGHRH